MFKRISSNLILTVISIVITLALLETGFRVYFFFTDSSHTEVKIPDYIQLLPDSGRYYGLKPSLAAPISTNTHGYRGKEFAQEKASGVYRIIMLGDSITFGNSVPWDKTFSVILEDQLNNTNTTRKFEIINLSISGYNTQQQLATLKEMGLSLNPDLILLNVCLNDSDPVKDVSSAGVKNKTSITKLSDINLRTIIASSHALTFLKVKFIEVFEGNKYIFRLLNSPDLFINNRVDEAAWGTMKSYMGEIHDIARSKDIGFGVIVYPYSSQVSITDAERRPQQDLQSYWSKRGVTILDPIPDYVSAEQDMFVDGTLHLSVYGHNRIASAIRSYLESSRLIP